MAEAAEWSRKHLHYEEIKIKGNNIPVKYASDPESYSVPNYYEYIPLQVKMAENDYKQKFLNKHIGTHTTLKLHMITCEYIMFKCNLDLTHKDNIKGHYRKVHQFTNGRVFHLKKER